MKRAPLKLVEVTVKLAQLERSPLIARTGIASGTGPRELPITMSRKKLKIVGDAPGEV